MAFPMSVDDVRIAIGDHSRESPAARIIANHEERRPVEG